MVRRLDLEPARVTGHPPEVQLSALTLADVNDAVERALNAEALRECSVVLDPGVLLTEGMDEHQRMPSVEHRRFDQGRCGPVQQLIAECLGGVLGDG